MLSYSNINSCFGLKNQTWVHLLSLLSSVQYIHYKHSQAWVRHEHTVTSLCACVWLYVVCACLYGGMELEKKSCQGVWCLFVLSFFESFSVDRNHSCQEGKKALPQPYRDGVLCVCVRVAMGCKKVGGACNQKLSACRPGPRQSSSMWEKESMVTEEIRVKFTNNS